MPFKFERLLVWQKAVSLSEVINNLVSTFPKEELYILSSQMKRAADSISLNIAEGSTGQTNAEFKRFLSYALRSDIELVACIFLGKKRGYVKKEDFEFVYKLCEELVVMINALKRSLT
jgi:four helix bundle protein